MRNARTNIISARIIVMDKKCDACEFLSHPTPKTQILETEYWSIGLGNNHAYFGRAYVTLKKHKNSLSSLSNEEWSDFEEIVRKLEKAYKDAFGAEPLNWGCFMNHAFRTEPFNPHVHWHIFPRYKVAPVFDGTTFADPLFGNFYDNSAERIVSSETAERIASKLRQQLS
jgi:diadenosine tetraphosphate (Ap4A) HIT family hydrolase